MDLENVLNEIFLAAYNEAKTRKDEYFTAEHFLYAALYFEEGIEIIENCDGDVEELKNMLSDYLDENIGKAGEKEPVQTSGIQEILSSAANHVLSCGKSTIGLGDVFAAIYDLKDSYASYFLKLQGIEKIDILNFITHGIIKTSVPSDENDDVPEELSTEIHSGIDENKADMKNSGASNNRSSKYIKDFTVELTEKVKRGEIDPVIGREEILQRTLQVLCRRQKNNPIHVGEPGVGKTAITEGIAQLVAEGKVPKILKDCKIYSLDMGALLAGTKYRGDFEERIKKVLNIIKDEEKAIIFIDEIHTVIGAGSISGGAMDASNILKPFLDRGKLRVIGATTYDEYKKVFEKDRALSRRFQKIEVTEPSVEHTVAILKGLKDKYEQYHNVKYTEEALTAAAELSSKYIQDRHLPDKAIDVIDEAGADVRLNSRDDEVIIITEKQIEKIVSAIGKIPEASVTISETEKLKSLSIELKNRIFGQDEAIDSIVRAVKRSRAGFSDENKPVANLLFVGPTGVGKTEISKQLASILGISLIRFDMSEYQEKHTVARLIGAPPGYVGYEEGGLLTDAIRKTPHCVLLLDEIEKVHPDVLNILLQLMDYATLTDNNGKKADFKNVILIMTSNAGAREIGKNIIGYGERTVKEEAISKEVERVFSPEFRNRLDDIIVFNKMNKEMAVLIARKTLGEFEKKLSAKNIKLDVSEKCYEVLAEKGMSSNFGAREILRIVEHKIKPYFVDLILFGDNSRENKVKIDIDKDEMFVFTSK